LRSIASLRDFAKDAVSVPQALDPLTWLAESREASRQYAYTPEVLGPVQASMKANIELPRISFSEDYLTRAGNLAQVRAAQAGTRLAAVWRECLGE
jgi:hypothetical protein